MVRRSGLFYGWIVLAVGFLTVMVSAGVRQSFGAFVKPMERDFGWDRAALALAASIGLLLYGLCQPFVGRLTDRFGPRLVLSGGLLLLGASAMLTSFVSELWELYLLYGFIGAVAGGAAGNVTVSALTVRWFERHRGFAISISSSGLSAGQLLVIPLIMFLVLTLDWRATNALMGGALILFFAPLALALVRDDPSQKGLVPLGASPDERGEDAPRRTAGAAPLPLDRVPLREAIRTRPFWLLSLGYFGCGFSSSGITLAHFIPAFVERGMDPQLVANALGLLGGSNIVGTLMAGYAADHFGRKNPLALVYFIRGLGLLLLAGVQSAEILILLGLIFGLSYVATVPFTTALTADFYGRFSMGTIYGMIFLSHQIGSATGNYLGGVLRVLTGDYTLTFVAGALVAFASAAFSFAISERPRARRVLPVSVSS